MYQEAAGMYQALAKPDTPASNHYQPINKSTLPRPMSPVYTNPSAEQLPSPVYQALDDLEPSRPQSPLYQTVEPEDETNQGVAAPVEEPLYRELDNEITGVNNYGDDDDDAI